MAGGLIVLRLIAAFGLRLALRKLPRPQNAGLRLALANLTRPGAATAGVVVALGLGLTLLATVSLLDSTIAAQVKDSLPGKAPSILLRRYPAGRNRRLRCAPSPASERRRITSARR